MSFHWTDDQRALFMELAAETGMSAAEIGEKIGKSRNAVISFAKRNDIPLPNAAKRIQPQNDRRAKRKAKQRAKRQEARRKCSNIALPPRPLPARRESVIVDGFEPVPFSKLIDTPGVCRFPVEDRDAPAGPDMLCCGAPVKNRKATHGLSRSYCAAHLEMMTRPPREGDAE